MADSKSRTAGTVYRDEAADLMAAAAGVSRAAPADLELTARRAPPVAPEAKRSLPYPEPVAINDNGEEFIAPSPRPTRRRLNPLRVAARVLIAPLYAVVAIGAVGVLALFGRGFLGI